MTVRPPAWAACQPDILAHARFPGGSYGLHVAWLIAAGAGHRCHVFRLGAASRRSPLASGSVSPSRWLIAGVLGERVQFIAPVASDLSSWLRENAG